MSICTRKREDVSHHIVRILKPPENPSSLCQFTIHVNEGLFMGLILVNSARAISPDLRVSRHATGQNLAYLM